MSPTDPNRLYSLSATLDPSGRGGGPIPVESDQGRHPVVDDHARTARGERVSWKVYQTPLTGQDFTLGNNVLPLFKRFQDPTSALYRKGLLPIYPGEFHADCIAGTLPQVSWVLAPPGYDEHPPSPSGFGELIVSDVLRA